MIKNLLILFISFVFIFTDSLNGYTLEIKVQNKVNNYSLERTFFSTEKSYELVENISGKEDSPIWLSNLIYPGIAQMMMGHNISGMAFIVSYSIVAIIEIVLIVLILQVLINSFSGTLAEMSNSNSDNKAKITYVLFALNSVLLFAIQIWSLFDAYNISKDYQAKDDKKKLEGLLINNDLLISFNSSTKYITDYNMNRNKNIQLNVFNYSF